MPRPTLRRCRLAGTGLYLPPDVVTAEALDARLGLEPGWVARKTGVLRRHVAAADETAAAMGARAARAALAQAGLGLADLDWLVCASGGMQQPIPCTAALVAAALGPEVDGVGCFDVNATCLSFVVALDTAAHALAAGSVERVLVVSTELASRGLDWDDPASATLFGDGAAAVVLERTSDDVGVLAFRLETYSEGAHYCEIAGGGSALTPSAYDGTNGKSFTFQMQGERLHRLVAERMPGFVERLFAPLGFGPRDVDAVIPHQAGGLPLRLLQRRLGLRDDTFVVTLADHGNTIAAAIPMALHLALTAGTVRPGHRVALLGTSAGVSLGGLVWQL